MRANLSRYAGAFMFMAGFPCLLCGLSAFYAAGGVLYPLFDSIARVGRCEIKQPANSTPKS
jgi:hypothetical protein